MAVSITLTGTSQNVTATNGSPNVTVTNTTGWVVGATVQGTGWAAGTKVVSFVTNTSAVLSSNFTGTTGTSSVIVSSNTGTLTVTLSASGDTASPSNIVSAGFGLLRGNKTLEVLGATKITLQLATGATWDDTEWVYELGNGSSLRLNETYGCGTWRSGWVAQGSGFVKAKGHTVNYNNFDNSNNAGGRNIFMNSGAPAGYPTSKPTLHWNDTAWFEASGTNAAAIPQATYSQWSPSGLTSGRLVFDYQNDGAGANAGFGGSWGTIESVLLNRCIGGVSTGADSTALVSIGKFEYFSLPTGNTTGTNPDIKMAFPNNLPFSGFAPLFYQSNPAQEFIGANTTNTEILDDYILPTDYPLATNSRNYNTNTRTYRRSVNFTLKDSAAANLANVTMYVTSGSNILVNAVQAGNFTQKLNTVVVSWVGRSPATGSYIAPLSTTDTRVQTAQFRKYGYQQQAVTYDLTNAAYSQPIFMLSESSLSTITEAQAAALTSVGINWGTKTITPTANVTYDQINARLAYELAQTANSAQVDPRTITGSDLVLAAGWKLVVNSGVTVSQGTKITYLYAPTVTVNAGGSITGVYGSTAGRATIWEFQGVQAGSSLAVWDSTGVTKYFASNVTAGTFRFYIAPGAGTGQTYYYAVEKYGKKREYGDFPADSGGVMYYVPSYVDDVGISQSALATVQAYTTVDTLDKFYDAIAAYRLTEAGIKLGQIADRAGTAVDVGAYNVRVNQSASAQVAIASGTITVRSNALANGTKYTLMTAVPPKTITGTTNEIITADIEDGNGDSSVTIVGGNGPFELWKVPTATATDDYATGTLMATTGNGKYRFIGVSGFDIIGRDTLSNIRARTTMVKGVYQLAFYVGEQIQLAQQPEVLEILDRIKVVDVDLDAIKGDSFMSASDSLATLSSKVDDVSDIAAAGL